MEPCGKGLQQYELLIGAVFVVFHAIGRFNTPETSRSGTTAARFHLAETCYVVFFVMAYWFLARSPDLLVKIVGDIPDEAHGFTSPFLAALCLTLLLPNIPVLSDMDRRARNRLHKIAAIPSEARRLSRLLQHCPWTVSKGDRQAMEATLLAMGMQPGQISFNSPTPVAPTYSRYLWTKVSALMSQLTIWEREADFGSFVTEFRDDHERVQRRYRRLQGRSTGALVATTLPEDNGAAPALASAARQLTTAFRDECQELLEEICDLISRGVLRCRIRQSARRDELTRMGFALPEVTCPDLTSNHLAALFLILASIILSCFMLVRWRDQPVHEVLLNVIKIPLIFLGAVFIAVYPKGRWKMTHMGQDRYRPFVFYLVAGVLAVGFGLTTSAFFNFLIQDFEVRKAWVQIATHSPFLLLAFVIAFATAWLTDNPVHKRLGCAQRWIEGASLATVTALGGVLVHAMLGQTMVGEYVTYLPPLWLVIGVSWLIGFVIGVLVPTWYRESQGPVRLASIGTVEGPEPLLAGEGQLA